MKRTNYAPNTPAVTAPPDTPAPVRSAAPDIQRLGALGVGLLLLTLAIAPVIGGLQPGAQYGGDAMRGALRILTLIAALCLSIAGFRGAATDDWAGRAARVAVWALFGWTLLSLLVHSRFLTSPVFLFVMLPATLDGLCYALVFTLALLLARDPRRRDLLVAALLIGAAWVAIAGAVEYGRQFRAGDSTWRTTATFFHPNFTAGFLALCLPIAVARFLSVRPILGRIVVGALAALVAGVLFTTGSRAGLGAALAGLLVAFGLAVAGRARIPWVRVGVLVVLVAVEFALLRAPVASRVTSGIAEGSVRGVVKQGAADIFRNWTWRGTLAMAGSNPLVGTGPGTYELLYPRYSLITISTHAHSSYLQLAATQGFPALLAALAALVFAFAGGLRVLRRPSGETSGAERLLLCGLFGALVAGALRSVFDSEWVILGNGIPFWAVAGLVAGARPSGAVTDATPRPAPAVKRAVFALGLVAAAALNLMLFYPTLALQNARAEARVHPREALSYAEQAARAWPPEPEALVLTGKLRGLPEGLPFFEQAARVEPSSRRLYPLADVYERQGRHDDALRTYQKAAQADPTSFGTLRALAELQERRGDHAAAVATWQKMARLYESPVGQIFGSGEFPETDPAWAYAALARDAADRGDVAGALDEYGKATAILEDYADTPPKGQKTERALALVLNEDLVGKRRELRTLYARVMDTQIALATKEADATRARALRERKQHNLALLNDLVRRALIAALFGDTQ